MEKKVGKKVTFEDSSGNKDLEDTTPRPTCRKRGRPRKSKTNKAEDQKKKELPYRSCITVHKEGNRKGPKKRVTFDPALGNKGLEEIDPNSILNEDGMDTFNRYDLMFKILDILFIVGLFWAICYILLIHLN